MTAGMVTVPMSVVVGVLLGAGLATVIGIGWALVHAPRAARTPAAIGLQSALHAATATLPISGEASPSSAAQAVPHLRKPRARRRWRWPTPAPRLPSTERAASRSAPATCSAGCWRAPATTSAYPAPPHLL